MVLASLGRLLGEGRGTGGTGVSPGAARAHSTLNESALDTTNTPVGFWAYARGWMNPFFQYLSLGTRNSFTMWYVLGHPVTI